MAGQTRCAWGACLHNRANVSVLQEPTALGAGPGGAWEAAAYSLFGPVIRDGPVQGDAVAELCVVPIFLVLALCLLAVLTQRGRHAALAQAPGPLHQANGLGEAWRETGKEGGQAGPRTLLPSPACPQPRRPPLSSKPNSRNSRKVY